MTLIFINSTCSIPLMIVPMLHDDVKGHYIFDVYCNKKYSIGLLKNSGNGNIHFENKWDPDYSGYIFLDTGKNIINYTLDGGKNLSESVIEELKNFIAYYQKNRDTELSECEPGLSTSGSLQAKELT